ncbi:heavy metal-associated domain, HMA [Artemisia annua]|uniref:Heavy metal-associated domain, HMA n=1 Tax=Artemisia annua TaxID=35608 RepID=A0A2U1MSC9_ARTAN|nr:heavy metal-associated domain, HMA [Artemisia annua]
MDMKDRKMTLTGNIDPVEVVAKLKKWHTEIVTVGPAKEEKKDDKKGDKKEKTEEEKKKEAEAEEAIRKLMEACRPYYPQRYCVHSVEDDPNGCVIC